jgi:hypothetical protein
MFGSNDSKDGRRSSAGSSSGGGVQANNSLVSGTKIEGHVLRPEPRTFAVRTAAGRHAALEFVSYYCPGAQPGCVTMRYRFLEP